MPIVDVNDDLRASIGLQIPNRGRHPATICMEGGPKRVLVMWLFFFLRMQWTNGNPKVVSRKRQ